MRIIIRAKNLRLNKNLRDYIERKINSLEKFSNIFRSEKYFDYYFKKEKSRVEVFVEIEKTTLHHQKGPFFRVECQFRFPNKSIRAEARTENLKKTIVKIKDKLQREIKQYKEKIISKRRRRFKK